MIFNLQQQSSSTSRQVKAVSLFILLLLLMLQCLPCSAKGNWDIGSANNEQHSYPRHPSGNFHLRGRGRGHLIADDTPNSRGKDNKQQQNLLSLGEELYSRSRSVEANIPTTTIFVAPSSTFQIIMSILLSILILLQLLVFVRFLRNRSKPVLEFAQPDVMCIFVACSNIATASCYLYVYVSSSSACAIREPLVFMSVSLMGATVGGRAWRMSTLVNNSLLTAGKNSNTIVSKMEQVRQLTLRMLSVLSGCDCSAMSKAFRRRRGTNISASGAEGGRSRPAIRVKVTFAQMMRATFFMILPQLFWQVAVLSSPMLRSSRELLSNTYLYNSAQMIAMEQYQCQSSVGLWPHCVSVFLALCPYVIAYILNIRPKSELDLLPEMIDEREYLERIFYKFVRVTVVAAPVIGLAYTNNPEAKVYCTICVVLALPLACCYYIAYLKLNVMKGNTSKQQPQSISRGRGQGADAQNSSTSLLRMANMYYIIGKHEKTVELVDQTFGLYQNSNAGKRLSIGGQNEGKQEVALGFTKKDLKALEEEELELIIRLLKLKINALTKLEGLSGSSKRAKMNIDAIKLFENCPAGRTMKDITFMYPMYNLAGEQIKNGTIDGGDEFALDMELATQCRRETQLQSYHFARSLASLAEIYGRLGKPDEAFKYFNVMVAVYMKQDHPKLLTDAYAVDRCATSFAASALWYLQKGEVNNAIERCDYVIDHILPHYDKNDIIGLWVIFIQLIRVLKWNGEAGKALEAYSKFMPEAAKTHWATKSLHKPIILVLQICEGSTHLYNEDLMSQDIDLVLSLDISNGLDSYSTHYGWSMKSLEAELCMLLASRLDAGSARRGELIERGIMVARIAHQRTKASNGKVKHIAAYEGNIDIYKKLLQLADIDEDVDVVEDFHYPTDTISHSQNSGKLDSVDSDSVMSRPSLSFSNKLHAQSASHISVPPKMRELSSLDSFGTTQLTSFQSQSCESIQEEPLQNSQCETIQEELSMNSPCETIHEDPSKNSPCETIQDDPSKHSPELVTRESVGISIFDMFFY